jgi:hypothetical protein
MPGFGIISAEHSDSDTTNLVKYWQRWAILLQEHMVKFSVQLMVRIFAHDSPCYLKD